MSVGRSFWVPGAGLTGGRARAGIRVVTLVTWGIPESLPDGAGELHDVVEETISCGAQIG